ncbi:MAG TPA: GNAT family N-acetyltransferase [Chloroflexota bacterium]|nr:GNAT family N-acetyltransferase [Chloroflexota bacterium]
MHTIEVHPVTTIEALLAAVGIRYTVFVREQGVPLHEEVDARDAEAYHVVAWRGGNAVGTGRLVVEGEEGIIGRMAVLPEARGQGVGAALLQELLAEARRRGLRRVRLAAQLHARGFYARFGFVASGPHFLDAGIAHQRMDLDLTG